MIIQSTPLEVRLSTVKRSLLNKYNLESCKPTTTSTTAHEANSSKEPTDVPMQAIEVSGEENFETRLNPMTTESAMKNGNGMILLDVRVSLRLLVELLVVLVELFVLLLLGSAQVPLLATVPVGQLVKQLP